jgi:hypothetical protein
MISIASYMSTTSLSTPYMNQTKNMPKSNSKKDFLQNDYDSDLETQRGNKGNQIVYDDDMDDLEGKNDDMDYWFKMQAKQINNNFNKISEHFSLSIDMNASKNSDPNMNETLKAPAPIIKKQAPHSNNSTMNSSISSVASSVIRMPSFNPLPSLNQNFITSPLNKLPTSTCSSKLDQQPVKEDTDETNPFLKDDEIDPINPFLEASDGKLNHVKNEDETNPFLDDDDKENHDTNVPKKSLEETENKVSNDRKSKIKPVAPKIETVKREANTLSPSNSQSVLNNSNTSKDLLGWCRETIDLTRNSSALFKNLTVNDFSNSWSNGLAFCALVHHFRPHLM